MSTVDTTHFRIDYSDESDEHIDITHVHIDPDEFVENPAFSQYVLEYSAYNRARLIRIVQNATNEDQLNAANHCLWQLQQSNSLSKTSSTNVIQSEAEEVEPEEDDIHGLDPNEYDPPLSEDELESTLSYLRKPR